MIILIMFRITISCNLKLPVCKNYMNFADTVGIYKYQRFGANILEISPFLLKLLRKYGVLMCQKIALKTPKTCLVRVVKKNDVISMTRKLKSETSSQKIDVSADIIPGSLTLLTGFVILDLKFNTDI